MNIDIERLKHDREYWDEVAPEGATHYGPETDFLASSWYMKTADSSQCWDESLLDWRSVYGHRSDIIPRPAKQWSGDGLPPVGVEFEFSLNGMSWDKRVMLFNDGVTCLMALKDYPSSRWHYKCEDPDMRFRPLKSEKDRVVEAALNALDLTIGSARDDEKVCAALYDLGALKMPEGE